MELASSLVGKAITALQRQSLDHSPVSLAFTVHSVTSLPKTAVGRVMEGLGAPNMEGTLHLLAGGLAIQAHTVLHVPSRIPSTSHLLVRHAQLEHTLQQEPPPARCAPLALTVLVVLTLSPVSLQLLVQ